MATATDTKTKIVRCLDCGRAVAVPRKSIRALCQKHALKRILAGKKIEE